MSRGLAALEAELGTRLLRRSAREVTLTAAGQRVLDRARRVLAEVDQLVEEAGGTATRLRIGHAWSAMSRHTLDFPRRWTTQQPGTELQLVRTNSPTAGLAEGSCDVAVLRVTPDLHHPDSALVGVERRLCAVAADDPWARRRSVRMSEIAGRTLVARRPASGGTGRRRPAHRALPAQLTTAPHPSG